MLILKFEHGIAVQGLLDFLLHFKRGKLQQADGLLKLGGHGERLTEFKLEGLFHRLIILRALAKAQSARAPYAP